jgi:hypothetical protein
MQFSPPSRHFIPLLFEYPPRHLVLKHPQPLFLSPRLMFMYRNRLIFYGEVLLVPRQTLKLEDHPFRLSMPRAVLTVPDCASKSLLRMNET